MELVNTGGRPPKKLDDKQIAQVEALASVLTKARLADYFDVTGKPFRAEEERQAVVIAHNPIHLPMVRSCRNISQGAFCSASNDKTHLCIKVERFVSSLEY